MSGAAPRERRPVIELAITPGGRIGDASPLARPGYKGPRRLSDYEREIAHALMRKGMTKSRAIAMARGLTNKAARTGRWGDKGKASAAVRAGSAASVAQRAAFANTPAGDVELSVRFTPREGRTEPDEESHRGADLSFTEALHPRSHGRFTFKHRGGKTVPRRKRRAPGKAARTQAKRAKAYENIASAQREQARRIVASQGLGGRGLTRSAKAGTPTGAYYGAPIRGSATSALLRGAGFSSFAHAQTGGDTDLAVLLIPRGSEVDLGVWSSALHPRDLFGRFRAKGEHDVKADEHFEKRYREHVAYVDHALEANRHLSTENHHAAKRADGSFDWRVDPERAALHDRVVDNVYRRMTKTAKKERQALFLGGLPGAGKSTALGKLPGIDQNDYVTVNPDIFKEELAKHGAVPHMEGLSPMEASSFVHEESSHLANMLADRARRNGFNIAYDITMNSPGSVHKRIDPLHDSGYTSRAVFVDIPHAMSQERVEKRHRSGTLRYWRDKSGSNLGQRLVPSSHVGASVSKRGTSSANFDAFQEVKHRFEATRLYDNSGAEPRLVESRGTF